MDLQEFIAERRAIKWHGRKTVFAEVPVSNLPDIVPEFEMQDFGEGPNANPYMQQIVRKPIGKDNREIPVAAVST